MGIRVDFIWEVAQSLEQYERDHPDEILDLTGGGDSGEDTDTVGNDDADRRLLDFVNDPALTARMLATLRRVAGADKVAEQPRTTTAEDFSRYASTVPGMIFSLGVTPTSKDPRTVASNHSPLFEADEGALPVGVRLLAGLAVDFLAGRN